MYASLTRYPGDLFAEFEGLQRSLDQLFGRSLVAQIVTLGAGLASAVAVYLLCARLLGIRELRALLSLRRRSGTTGE